MARRARRNADHHDRIQDELKARVAAAARRVGKTPHAFILDPIADTVEQSEVDEEFHRIADERWADYVAKGEYVAWEDMRPWLEARARGENPPRPKVRKHRR